MALAPVRFNVAARRVVEAAGSLSTVHCGETGAAQTSRMSVGDIAKLVGVKPHVVRYYARAGLLVPRRNEGNGYKEFSREDVTRLRCIRAARGMGFSVAEIAGLLGNTRRGGRGQAELHDLVLRKHADLVREHGDLEKMLERVQRLLALCAMQDVDCGDLRSLCAALERAAGSAPDHLPRSGRQFSPRA